MSSKENLPLQSPNFYDLTGEFDSLRTGTPQEAATIISGHLGITTFPIHLENIATNYFGIDIMWIPKLGGYGYLVNNGEWMALAERIREDPIERDMTIAHELGHFIHIKLGLHDTSTSKERENYADIFASHFLHPNL